MPNLRHSLRWALRRRLRRLRPSRPLPAGQWRDVLYLFSGTYGDFAQILNPLAALAAAAPEARIHLLASPSLAEDFRAFLPPSTRRVGFARAFFLCLRGVDLLLVNAVGVYRTRFDVLASLGGRMALGFRHAEEKSRAAFSATLPLLPAIRNFESANDALLRLAGLKPPASPDFAAGEAASGSILFHAGSAGMKSALGLDRYVDLVQAVLAALGDRVEAVLLGPGDGDLRARVGFDPARIFALPLFDLAEKVRSHPGSIVCFNSFFAHFCRHLGRPAVVLHWEKIPYGYDCDPPHRQLILPAGPPWNLQALREAFAPKAG